LTGFRLAEPVWAPNLVTLSPGVKDDDGDAAVGVEAEGEVRDEVGDGDGIEGGCDVEGGDIEVGQPDDAKPNFTVIRVSRRRGYSPYTRYIIGID
jgi:hypothetical protein